MKEIRQTRQQILQDICQEPPSGDGAEDGMQWYAMRVFRNRIFTVRDEFGAAGFQTYMAMRTVDRIEEGRLVYKEIQVVPSLLFVRCGKEWLLAYKEQHFSDIMLYGDAPGREPSPIDDKEMRVFMLVTSADGGRDIDPVEGMEPHFAQGERVRVIDGIYKGAEGVVKRIRKDRKLLIAVTGVAIVAVSHIPQSYLEKIET